MRFVIADALFERHPHLTVAVLLASNLIIQPDRSPAAAELVAETEQLVRDRYASTEIGQLPPLAAWRAAYKAFGADPRQYAPSVEALVRRVRSTGSLPRISNLVDVYNCLSIRYLAPIGADDLDHVHGDLGFRQAAGHEHYVSLGGQDPDPPDPGEVIYADDQTVLCRRWNWRGGHATRVTPATRCAILTIQAIDPATAARIPEAAADLSHWLQTTTNAHVSRHLLNPTIRATPDLSP